MFRSIVDQLSDVLLDSAPVIYYLENREPYATQLERLFERVDSGELRILVSPVTVGECLVKPFQVGDQAAVQRFETFFYRSRHVTVTLVDGLLAHAAAELAGRHGLQFLDAVQAATALHHRCDALLTNDQHFRRVADRLNVLILDDFADLNPPDTPPNHPSASP